MPPHPTARCPFWHRSFFGILLILVGAPCAAQSPLPIPNGTPTELQPFFDRMFGPTTPEEQQRLDAIDIPWRAEQAWGEQQLGMWEEQLAREGWAIKSRGLEVDYLRRLVTAIQPQMVQADRYRRLAVRLIDSPAVDARVLPGGTIFVYRGLLDFAESEAAVVGILGHELSHLDRGHLLLPLKQFRMMQADLQAFQQGPSALAQGQPWQTFRLMARPFRPEDEAAADADGARWAFAAGYDPREMAHLFARLHQQKQDPKFPFAEYFRTHPYDDQRAAAIAQQAEVLRQQQPDQEQYRGSRNLRERVTRSQKRFVE